MPAPRGCHQEAARPLTGEHAPTPPATGPSCGNGDSTRLQVHEQLSASANPLPKCDVGSAHGEQTQQKLQCRDGNGPCELPELTPEPESNSHSPAAAKKHCPLPSPPRERMAHLWVLRSPRSQLLHRPTFPSLPQHPRVQPQPKSLVLVSQELLKGILPQSVLGISSLGPCGAGKWGKCALNYLAFYLALPLGAWLQTAHHPTLAGLSLRGESGTNPLEQAAGPNTPSRAVGSESGSQESSWGDLLSFLEKGRQGRSLWSTGRGGGKQTLLGKVNILGSG